METELMLKGYGLTTAQMYYHMPDYTHVLNTFTWQEYDIAPDFPELKKFLNFWETTLDGALHSVTVASCEIISPSEYHAPSGEFLIH